MSNYRRKRKLRRSVAPQFEPTAYAVAKEHGYATKNFREDQLRVLCTLFLETMFGKEAVALPHMANYAKFRVISAEHQFSILRHLIVNEKRGARKISWLYKHQDFRDLRNTFDPNWAPTTRDYLFNRLHAQVRRAFPLPNHRRWPMYQASVTSALSQFSAALAKKWGETLLVVAVTTFVAWAQWVRPDKAKLSKPNVDHIHQLPSKFWFLPEDIDDRRSDGRGPIKIRFDRSETEDVPWQVWIDGRQDRAAYVRRIAQTADFAIVPSGVLSIGPHAFTLRYEKINLNGMRAIHQGFSPIEASLGVVDLSMRTESTDETLHMDANDVNRLWLPKNAPTKPNMAAIFTLQPCAVEHSLVLSFSTPNGYKATFDFSRNRLWAEVNGVRLHLAHGRLTMPIPSACRPDRGKVQLCLAEEGPNLRLSLLSPTTWQFATFMGRGSTTASSKDRLLLVAVRGSIDVGPCAISSLSVAAMNEVNKTLPAPTGSG